MDPQHALMDLARTSVNFTTERGSLRFYRFVSQCRPRLTSKHPVCAP